MQRGRVSLAGQPGVYTSGNAVPNLGVVGGEVVGVGTAVNVPMMVRQTSIGSNGMMAENVAPGWGIAPAGNTTMTTLRRSSSWGKNMDTTGSGDRSKHSIRSAATVTSASSGLDDEFGLQDAANKALIQQYHNQSLYMQSRCEQWEIKREDVALGAKVAEGDFGAHYEAVWRSTKVSARIVDGESAEEIMKELKIWSHIRHPNLVLFMGSVVKTEPFIIISEYMSGGTLQDRCLGQPAKFKQFANWSVDLARALTFLHNCHPPILHGNLKPSNLMLNADDHLCVSNFANSQVILKRKKSGKRGASRPSLTTSLEVGKPLEEEVSDDNYSEGARYASPEALALRPIDDMSDIWSFGMILFFMASGTHPHQSLSVNQAVDVLLRCRRPDLSLLSFSNDDVCQVITDTTAPLPQSRPSIVRVFEMVKPWQDITSYDIGEGSGKCVCAIS